MMARLARMERSAVRATPALREKQRQQRSGHCGHEQHPQQRQEQQREQQEEHMLHTLSKPSYGYCCTVLYYTARVRLSSLGSASYLRRRRRTPPRVVLRSLRNFPDTLRLNWS